MSESHVFMRLITCAGADADKAVDTLQEIVAQTAGVRAVSVDSREPYPKGGLDREAAVVLFPGDRESVVGLYDSLRQIAASGWTDINDKERNAVWNRDRAPEPLLATVVWAEMAAIEEDGTVAPQR